MADIPIQGKFNSTTVAQILADAYQIEVNDTELAALGSRLTEVLKSIKGDADGAYVKPTGGIPKTDLDASVQTSLTAADNAVPSSEKGTAGGVAELDANGKVPSAQLPSYVDDVIEGYYYNNKFWTTSAHTTEIPGETGKIYTDLATDKTYRWGGSAFAVISDSLALGETSSTAYAGDKGKQAFDTAAAALPKSGGTMSGALSMGGNKITGLAAGSANGDAVRYEQLVGLIKIATGTIATNATSVTVNYSGTLIGCYATMGGVEVLLDKTIAASSVAFSVAQNPTSAITCKVVYV